MNWHYVEQEQQVGPVSNEQLAQLVQEGKINGDTLVWNEGLANWTPYREINPGVTAPQPALRLATPVASPAADEVGCAECGQRFPVSETIRHGNAYVCAACKPVFLQRLAEGARVQNTGELQYARILLRFGAVFLDGLMLWVVNFTIGFVIGLVLLNAERGSPMAIAIRFGVILINIAIAMTYEAFFIGKYGATLGKMACKIKVVMADGGRVSYGRAFGRYFAKMLSNFTCLIGYIIAIFDGEKRALHDHICNTRVVVN